MLTRTLLCCLRHCFAESQGDVSPGARGAFQLLSVMMSGVGADSRCLFVEIFSQYSHSLVILLETFIQKTHNFFLFFFHKLTQIFLFFFLISSLKEKNKVFFKCFGNPDVLTFNIFWPAALQLLHLLIPVLNMRCSRFKNKMVSQIWAAGLEFDTF